jgi:hypothetical protein
MPSRLHLYHCERMFLLHCDGAVSGFALHHHFWDWRGQKGWMVIWRLKVPRYPFLVDYLRIMEPTITLPSL